jgi:ribosomal protein S18 acetylase RimI-like enzyme
MCDTSAMPDSSIAIRRASPQDAVLLAELGARTFKGAFGSLTPEPDLMSYLAEAFTVERLSLELADPRSTFLIALVNGDPVGYAKLHAGSVPDCVSDKPAVELVRLYSSQEWLGRGVGAALMETCLELARQKGYSTVWLSSWKRNHRANAFYRKWRFQVVGSKTFVVGTDVQEDFILARPLEENTRFTAQIPRSHLERE